jgi:hypothetical protein
MYSYEDTLFNGHNVQVLMNCEVSENTRLNIYERWCDEN